MDVAAKQDPRFHEIPRERVADRVAQELLRMISGGDLAPGERLPGERHLAQMMGVSRVSVRAALQQLKAQGLISANQGGSTRVVANSGQSENGLGRMATTEPDSRRDLAELLGQLQAWAVRRAALLAEESHISELQNIFDRMSDPKRPPEARTKDGRDFHQTIAKAADSAVYLHMMNVLGDVFGDDLALSCPDTGSADEERHRFLDQHRAILDAVRAGDLSAAAKAMNDHLTFVTECYDGFPREPKTKKAHFA